MSDDEQIKLNEFDKIEWRDLSKLARPDWTDEQFEEYWSEFVEMKRRKKMH